MTEHQTPTRAPRRRLFSDAATAFAILWLMGTLWAIAGPVFSAPDENAHAVKAIAAVRGDLTGEYDPDAHYPVVDLPDEYRYSPGIVCFAYQPERAADCDVELGDPRGADEFSTWVARYNPAYYVAVGWPTLVFDGNAGVIAMRIVGSAIVSAFLAFAIALGLASQRARWMPAAVPFLAAPMVVYMGASVSPQGLEIAAAALLWVATLRLLDSFGEGGGAALPRTWLWAAVVVAASALSIARALGPLWAVIIVAACLLIAQPRAVAALFTTRSSYLWVIPIAAVAGISTAWTLLGGTFGGQAAEGDAPLVGGTFIDGAWAMLRQTPNYIVQSAGVFGWLDTDLPSPNYITYFSALAVLLVLVVAGAGRAAARRLGAAILIAVTVPVIVQASSVSQTGIIWQGRYGMFLYIGVPIVAVLLLSASRYADRIAHLARPVSIMIAVAILLHSIVAFVYVLYRFGVGAGSPVGEMLAPDWQPPGGWMLLTGLYALAVAVAFVWQVQLARRAERLEPAETP